MYEDQDTLTIEGEAVFDDCKESVNARGVLSDLQSQLTLFFRCSVESWEGCCFSIFVPAAKDARLSDDFSHLCEFFKKCHRNQSYSLIKRRIGMPAVYEETTKKDIELRGEIVECSRVNGTAKIKTGKGEIVCFNVPDEAAFEIIIDSLSCATPTPFRKNRLVLLRGEAEYRSDGTLLGFDPDTVEKLNFLDSIYRLEHLLTIEDNWDGDGSPAPDKEGLMWLIEFFRLYPPNFRPPYIFPNEDGNLDVEWSQDNNEMVFLGAIDLKTHRIDGMWYSQGDLDNEKDVSFNLDDPNEAGELFSLIGVYGESLDEE